MRVVALVPRRSDGGRRDKIWSFVAQRWQQGHGAYELFEGHHDDGPFNRSAAVNAAARRAGDWDYAVVMDADSFVDFEQVEMALAKALGHGQLVFAHDVFAYLTKHASELLVDGWLLRPKPSLVEWEMRNTASSCLVVPRPLWDDVGGFDDGFVGWGMEDVAFSVACQAVGGGAQRVAGRVWHLWHEPSPENAETSEFKANVERLNRYIACRDEGGDMRELIHSLRSTVDA